MLELASRHAPKVIGERSSDDSRLRRARGVIAELSMSEGDQCAVDEPLVC